MSWGLTQGLLGAKHKTLAPSLLGVGPNAYLGRRDFFLMLAAAIVTHLIAFGIASLFPQEKVMHIPVRALSFKLGDQGRIAARGVPTGATQPVAAPVMQASAPVQAVPAPVLAPATATPRIAPTPMPVKPSKIAPVQPAKPQPRTMAQKPVETEPKTNNYDPAAEAPAIATQPQQYVREVGQVSTNPSSLAPLPTPGGRSYGAIEGAMGGSGAESSVNAKAMEVVRRRYEQDISAWIERHKIYPAEAGGKQGRVIVRVRIDRTGVVRYYALEQSSGSNVIDIAAVDMVRRANPVPAVPANYPAGNLIEFLIPINFHP